MKQYLVTENIDVIMNMMADCNQLSLWLNLYNIDPLLPGEIALKTALLLEAQSNRTVKSLFTQRSVAVRVK